MEQENEKLVSSYKATSCVCAYTSLNMDDYKSLQIEFEKFKKDHYEDLIMEINPIGPNLNWIPPLSNWFCLVGVPKSKRLTMVLG